MKVWISGPMTGYEDYNFPAFDTEAERLRSKGHEVFNPTELPWITGEDYGQILLDVLARLKEFMPDVLLVLPGWKESRGARCEIAFATALGILVAFKEVED